MKKKMEKSTKRILRKRPCRLCRDKVEKLDYKEVDLLSKFVSDRGRIIASRLSGNCSKHQRMVSNAIKRARLAALLPFVKVKEGLQRRRTRRDE